MRKYIDAEELKNALSNRYTEITVPIITDEGGIESYYRRSELHHIIKLIDSLRQEQPVSPDNIDEAIEKIADEIMPQYPDISWDDCREKVIVGIKAGAEWMAKQNTQPDVDLSEETITKEFHIINDRCFNEGIEGWQKEKLIARHFWSKGYNARKEESK